MSDSQDKRPRGRASELAFSQLLGSKRGTFRNLRENKRRLLVRVYVHRKIKTARLSGLKFGVEFGGFGGVGR